MQEQKQQQAKAQEQKAEIMNSILSTEAQQRRASPRHELCALAPSHG
jgi:DNA-binding TFAR19-related protein (PDSD5 family)